MTNKASIYRIYFNTENSVSEDEINSFLVETYGYSTNSYVVERLHKASRTEYILDLRIPLRNFEEENLIRYLKQEKNAYYFADNEKHYMEV